MSPGAACLCVLCGLPAAGKSRLARELRGRAQTRGWRTLLVTYDELIPARDWQESEWKQQRKTVLMCLERFLHQTLSGQTHTLSGQTQTHTLSGQTHTLSGQTQTHTLSGQTQTHTLSGQTHTLSGQTHTLSGQTQTHTLSGQTQTLSGQTQTHTLSGQTQTHTLSGQTHTLSGQTHTLSGQTHTLSGQTQTHTLSGQTQTHTLSGQTQTHTLSGQTQTHTLSGQTQTHTLSGQTQTHTLSGQTQTHTLSGQTHTLSGQTQTHTLSGQTHTLSGQTHTLSGQTQTHTLSGQTQTHTLSGQTQTHTLSGQTQTHTLSGQTHTLFDQTLTLSEADGVWMRFEQMRQHQSVSHTHSQPLMVLLDDNFYYQSMRYQIQQLARKYGVGFCQVFLQCPLHVCLQRNRCRSQPVPDDVLLQMCERMEPPNEIRNPWEQQSLTLDSTDRIADGHISWWTCWRLRWKTL
ncbi:serine-rich adhesin for platelets isoform X2 [Cyprinus carpio]|uniref:Serine-rich adhesin for platelets isoform X2 n=1 Tax=Cyprinus carpio TaxID=7962 RepID=A0A9Q9Y1K0_CYPCA|nr:serine-rich adhesin for platelets isoform X2 [Cyprinus carpio]